MVRDKKPKLTNIVPAWLVILRAINKNPGCTQVYLARNVTTCYNQIYPICIKMEYMGWIKREKVNGRELRVTITAKGLETLRDFRRVGEDFEKELETRRSADR